MMTKYSIVNLIKPSKFQLYIIFITFQITLDISMKSHKLYIQYIINFIKKIIKINIQKKKVSLRDKSI